MKETQILQEIRRMRFMEAYEGWQERRLSQKEATSILGVHERTFRRYIARYEESGEKGLYDKRLTQASHRAAPVDEVIKMTEEYRNRYYGWNVKHYYSFLSTLSSILCNPKSAMPFASFFLEALFPYFLVCVTMRRVLFFC